jgi:hypothetical protein
LALADLISVRCSGPTCGMDSQCSRSHSDLSHRVLV